MDSIWPRFFLGRAPPSSTNQKTSVDSSQLKGPRLRTGWTTTNRTQLVGKAARDFCDFCRVGFVGGCKRVFVFFKK